MSAGGVTACDHSVRGMCGAMWLAVSDVPGPRLTKSRTDNFITCFDGWVVRGLSPDPRFVRHLGSHTAAILARTPPPSWICICVSYNYFMVLLFFIITFIKLKLKSLFVLSEWILGRTRHSDWPFCFVALYWWWSHENKDLIVVLDNGYTIDFWMPWNRSQESDNHAKPPNTTRIFTHLKISPNELRLKKSLFSLPTYLYSGCTGLGNLSLYLNRLIQKNCATIAMLC